jgi:hypothetical protein
MGKEVVMPVNVSGEALDRSPPAAPKAHTHRSLGQRPRTRSEKCTHPEGVPHLPSKAVSHHAGRRFCIDTDRGGRGRPPSSGVESPRLVGKEPRGRARPGVEGDVPGRRNTEADDADAAGPSGRMQSGDKSPQSKS